MRLKRILEKVGWRGKLTILAVVKRVVCFCGKVRRRKKEDVDDDDDESEEERKQDIEGPTPDIYAL